MTRWPYTDCNNPSPRWPVWLLVVAAIVLLIVRAHGGTVQIIDTATITRFAWSNKVAQVSSNMVDWVDYDTQVYSLPVAVSGTNLSVGYVKAFGATNWTERITNQIQGLNFIGTDYLVAMRATNQPPLPP
jgi:hypothetical protein